MVTLLTPVCKYINPPQSYVKGNWPQRFVYVVNLLHNAVKLDLFTSTVGTDVDQPQVATGGIAIFSYGVWSLFFSISLVAMSYIFSSFKLYSGKNLV